MGKAEFGVKGGSPADRSRHALGKDLAFTLHLSISIKEPTQLYFINFF